MAFQNPLTDPFLDGRFSAGGPEATQHNRLKFFESRVLVEATRAAAIVKSPDARRHLHRGFVIRHMMMQESRIEIRQRTLSRRDPLDHSLATKLSIHLNAYYLNLKGAMDNLAYAAAFEHSLLAQSNPPPGKVKRFCTLENNEFRTALAARRPQTAEALHSLDQWFREVKRFRDPAAHRIPLVLVSAILTQEDRDKHEDLAARAVDALLAEDFAAWGRLKVEQGNLGKFIPILAEPFGPQGELVIAPNQIAFDQETYLGIALLFFRDCFPTPPGSTSDVPDA